MLTRRHSTTRLRRDARAVEDEHDDDDDGDDDACDIDVRGDVRCTDGARTRGDGWCATNDDDGDAG